MNKQRRSNVSSFESKTRAEVYKTYLSAILRLSFKFNLAWRKAPGEDATPHTKVMVNYISVWSTDKHVLMCVCMRVQQTVKQGSELAPAAAIFITVQLQLEARGKREREKNVCLFHRLKYHLLMGQTFGKNRDYVAPANTAMLKFYSDLTSVEWKEAGSFPEQSCKTIISPVFSDKSYIRFPLGGLV